MEFGTKILFSQMHFHSGMSLDIDFKHFKHECKNSNYLNLIKYKVHAGPSGSVKPCHPITKSMRGI